MPFPLPRLSVLLPVVTVVACWAVVFQRLSGVWSAVPHYAYGWAVPLIAAWLWWERGRDRPAPAPAAGRGIAVAAALLAVLFLPTRVVAEAFPDWRPVVWMLALTATGLALLVPYALGGRPWLRHFAFAALFPLVAVPWPTPLEDAVLQGLMRANARFAAEVLTLFGEPAVCRGNLIEVGGGLVGIDEACSGMRSMQASVMIALLVGEVFRFRGARRLALLAAGLALAFGTNFARSLYLVARAAADGTAAVAGVHDEAGYLTMGVCVAGLWLLALAWRRPAAAAPSPPPHAALPPTRWLGVGLAVAVVVAEAGTAAWYGWREPTPTAAPPRPAWPVAAPGFQPRGISEPVRQILGIDDGDAAEWRREDGSRWIAHWLRWEPAPAARAILARYHTPDICLPAAGAVLRDDEGMVAFTAGARRFVFRRYAFEERGRTLFVYYSLMEDRAAADPSTPGGPLALQRLRWVWEGRRITGQTALHVAVWGRADGAAADAALRTELAQWFGPG